MFNSPFPNTISFACGDISSIKGANLHFQEEQIAKTFDSSKRKTEFALGREIARLALKKFNLGSKPILRNHKTREPCWPKSVCGSITHTGNFAAAAVGLKNDFIGIGIDLEDITRKINFKISKYICIEDEFNWLKKQTPEQANINLRIIFSAKESIFKCYFPVVRKYFQFKDAFVKINEEKSEFNFKLSKTFSDIENIRFNNQGFFSFKEDLLLTYTYIKNIH